MTTAYRLALALLLALASAYTLKTAAIAELSSTLLITLFVACAIAALISPSLENLPGFSANREKGKVKWFNVSKGYGFITREDGEDVFVHFRSIRGRGRRSLFEDQDVEFIVTQGEKGPQAEDVRPLSKV
jgi:CspA family cold shock protein